VSRPTRAAIVRRVIIAAPILAIAVAGSAGSSTRPDDGAVVTIISVAPTAPSSTTPSAALSATPPSSPAPTPTTVLAPPLTVAAVEIGDAVALERGGEVYIR